ncbi:MAG: hypothetical protein NVSMB21_11050 [Vulcanimicrobiaceae bacterium]
MTSAAPGAPARRASDPRRRYRSVFGGFAVLTLAITASLASLVVAHRGDARGVDACGLERMRSQRIAFLVERLAAPGLARAREPAAGDVRRELVAVTHDFRAAIGAIARARSDPLAIAIDAYASDAEAVAVGAAGRDAARERISARRLPLLAALDDAVHERAARSSASLDRIVLALAFGALGLLAAVGAIWSTVVVPYERRDRQTAARLRALYDSNPDAVATYDLTGAISSGNLAALRLVGGSPESLIGSHFASHMASEVLPEARLAFARTIAGEATEFETIFVRRDGERRTVLANLVPNSVDGSIVGIYAIGRDITALTQARTKLRESEQRFRSLFEQNADPIGILDRKGVYLDVNPAMEALSGVPASAFVGRQLGSLGLAASDNIRLRSDAIHELAAGRSVPYDVRMVNRAGKALSLQGRAVPIVYGGDVHGFFAISRDVTEERRTRSEILEGTKRLQELYLVAASSGRSSDEQIARALELGRARLGFDSAYYVSADGPVGTVRAMIGDAVERVGETVALERSLLRHCLEKRDIHVIADAALAPWCAGTISNPPARSFVAIPIAVAGIAAGALAFSARAPRETELTPPDRDFVRLIAALVGSALERGRQRAELDALAFFDSLTGLPNRALLDARIDEAIVAARERDGRFAVLFVDLDGFKGVNDRSGHAGGDAVLCEVARRLECVVEPGDTVGRLGGDEFVLLTPLADGSAGAEVLARRVLSSLAEPFVLEDATHVLGCSVGSAIFPTHGSDGRTLMERADRALYRAKSGGGGRCSTVEESARATGSR